MVDMTAKLFWYRTKEWYENMADKLNDIVYTDDSKETVDVINLLLLGWILLGLIVYIIGTVIANQLRKRKATFSSGETDISPDGKLSESTERVSCVKPDATKLSSENLEKTVIPTCSGDEQEIVDWVNSVFLWIYRNRVISPILTAWVSALNARTRLLSTEHGILIDFKDVTLTCGSPEIQEVMETCSTRGDLNVKCNMEIENISFDITVTQVKERDKTVTPFLLNVKKIFGKVNIECNPEDLSFVAKYSEAPEVELSAETVQNATENVENQEALNSVVCEICSEAFSSAIVDLKLSCYSECPRLVLKSVDSEEEVESIQTTKNEAEEKLLVKIIKASNLGGNEGCIQPYCVVEMDEPPQKFETKALQEKFNPFWDESFTFCVKDISAELLFEIYDKGKPSKENFLGLGIVSVDELIQNPSQRQIIPLQSRPLEDDYVTGSLTTEFLFLSHIIPITETTHLSPKTVASNGKSVETNSRVTAGGTIITTTTIKRTKEGMSDNDDYCYDIDNNDIEADLTGTALKELEKQSKPKNSTSKSTLIIHSVQRVAVDKSGQWQEVQEADSSFSESLEASPASHLSKDSRTSYSESVPSSPSEDKSGDDRSRSKEKKSLFGSLRRRLSFRKARSKSAENRSEPSNYSQGSSRSASSDRLRSRGQKPSPIKGKFMGMKFLAVPGSTRSSLSEVSGISASSSRTYINENSTLVIETNENGIIKRYLIPNSLVHHSKWKKRGTKLHIYNDHVFIAKHLSGSTICKVCQKYLTRRPGKQGYECRGCNLQCHKSCHVKIENYCSNSSINSMEVEYIHDPKGETPKSV